MKEEKHFNFIEVWSGQVSIKKGTKPPFRLVIKLQYNENRLSLFMLLLCAFLLYPIFHKWS